MMNEINLNDFQTLTKNFQFIFVPLLCIKYIIYTFVKEIREQNRTLKINY